MRWTVRLEARTDTGEVETTELVTIGRPVVGGTLAELGLALSEAKSVLAKLQASMVQSQVADYAACHRVCPQCRVPQPLKDRRSRRLQTLFGTVEVEAPRFRVCRCRPLAPTAAVTLSPVCALLTARCTPELERVQAELGARTSFREAARILEALLPAPPANHEGVRSANPCPRKIRGRRRRGPPDGPQVASQPRDVRVIDLSCPSVRTSRTLSELDFAHFTAPGGQVWIQNAGSEAMNASASSRLKLAPNGPAGPHAPRRRQRTSTRSPSGSGFSRATGAPVRADRIG